VVHPAVTATNLPQYFLEHMIYGLELLSKVLGISADDATLIIHSILKEMHDLHDFPQSGLLLRVIITMCSIFTQF